MPELHDLLDRATDAIEPRGGAAEALRVVRRRRTQRRGTASALAAATAVAVVVVGVRLGTAGTDDSMPRPAETPTAAGIPDVAPEIAPDRIQDVWDPRNVEDLPVTDLGVPRVMPSDPAGSIDRPPVALLDNGSHVLAVAADGAAVKVALPDDVGDFRTVSLSPDGTRVVVVDSEQLSWRHVNSSTWRRIQIEEKGVLGDGVDVEWVGARSAVVLRGWRASARVDLDTGQQQAVSGDVLAEAGVGVLLGPLGGLSRPLIADDSIAAARTNLVTEAPRSAEDADGLIALDRETLETRGFLPMRYEDAWYVHGGNLTPIAWLDEDTVAFRVLPPDSPKECLVTWNVETGELSRISCWLTSYQASFATGLLGR